MPIPEGSRIRVAVDSTRIVVDGRIMDLPPETRTLFGPMMLLVDTTSTLRAEVIIGPSGPGVVRFVLATIIVNGFSVPESILAPFLLRVGERYPVLTKTGRELLVAIPPDGKVSLMQDGVRLWIDENAQAVLRAALAAPLPECACGRALDRAVATPRRDVDGRSGGP